MMGADPTAADPDGLQVVRLVPGDLDRLYALHRDLHAEAGPDAPFVFETRGFFERHLGDHGLVLGLLAGDGTLAGYSVLGLPAAEDPANFGADLGLPAGERAQVAHLDGTGLRPAWRRRGLQRHLVRRRLDIARSLGRRIALSTAAPGNPWSLANLLAEGLAVVALVEKYASLRFVLRQDVDAAAGPSPAASGGPRIALDDAAAHRRALADGWRGVALEMDAAGAARLVYAAPGGGDAP